MSAQVNYFVFEKQAGARYDKYIAHRILHTGIKKGGIHGFRSSKEAPAGDIHKP